MSTTQTIEKPASGTATRLRRLTRIAGVLYLAIFILYPLSTGLRSSLVVPDDATATAEAIRGSEGLFRLGMAGEASIFLIEIGLAAVLYGLFRPVSRAGSFAGALARVSEGVVMAAGNVFTSIATLVALGGAGYLAAYPPDQLDALALFFQEANDSIILVWGLFFALSLMITGWLAYRSGFIPRLPGVLLALAGVGYLLQSFGVLIAPGLAGPLEIVVMVLAIPGELVFALWLLIKGVDTDAWTRRASESAGGAL
ncbi:DUF4386 domain-containing protein [Demequina mangrovi]|uniref:DUF4386 domain-containing protein n=1 Tax=Demequina mangrovi TaxID=1043493 RepID=A0A1H6UW30_9MICO|nr:DUF4386 domain-containing protein [Demequina mangrovi]SEI95846.1 protein of unknown function [Demequina mangrovi]